MSYELLLDDHHGIYIPQFFAEEFFGFEGIDEYDLSVCKTGPEHRLYWEAWDQILEHAYCVDKHGREWKLYQDGALWVYCPDMMTEEDNENLFGGH